MIVVLRWHPPKRCSLHMQPRQVVVLTPPKSSYPRMSLSRQQSAPISPLAAILLKSPTSVANKRLTRLLSPLAATLTKNRGEGGVMVNQIPVGFNVPTCRRSDVSTFQRSSVQSNPRRIGTRGRRLQASGFPPVTNLPRPCRGHESPVTFSSIQCRNRVPLTPPPAQIVHRNVEVNFAARRLDADHQRFRVRASAEPFIVHVDFRRKHFEVKPLVVQQRHGIP